MARVYFPRCAQLVEVIFSGRQMMCQKHAGVRMTCGRWRVKECCTKVMYVYNGISALLIEKNKKNVVEVVVTLVEVRIQRRSLGSAVSCRVGKDADRKL